MSVFDIGDYRIQFLNNDWRVSWQEPNTTIRHHLDFNLEQLIRMYVEGHLADITKLLFMFDLKPEKLLDDPLGIQVLRFLPDTGLVPGKDLPESQVREWHHRQLVQAYNTMFATKFTYEMVRNRLP